MFKTLLTSAALFAAAVSVAPNCALTQTAEPPLGIPMDRMGSGTTWIPDAVTLPSRRLLSGAWEFMLHAFVFGQYDKQSGPRGDSQSGSLNWAMFMASRDLAGGRFQARTMLSLDAATVTPSGYPLLLQTGETYRAQPLHDRQHPHDFWMELGVLYERPVTSGLGVSLYAAPSGEPALGPVAFMHRPSAMDDPVAPLGHHWQDATHISFGVLTAGIFGRQWKLEGSAFNGREPNEKRWDFDAMRLDSYSGRFTVNPDSQWSLHVGYGFLKSPEALTPDESVHRLTGSILHGRKVGSEGQWATAAVWGSMRTRARRAERTRCCSSRRRSLTVPTRCSAGPRLSRRAPRSWCCRKVRERSTPSARSISGTSRSATSARSVVWAALRLGLVCAVP